jgi:HPt (histidine-containing phosphotransfer) domain-containing protein
MVSALQGNAVLDLARLEEAFEDDTDGIAELLELALETGVKHRAAIAAGIAAGDAEVVRKAAHGIKGSSGNIGAMEVMALASDLEQRARAGSLEGASASSAEIDAAYERVADAVRAYRARIG